MTDPAKQSVLIVHPTAYAAQHGRIKNWHIFIDNRRPSISEPGIYATADQAWAAAARRLKP